MSAQVPQLSNESERASLPTSCHTAHHKLNCFFLRTVTLAFFFLQCMVQTSAAPASLSHVARTSGLLVVLYEHVFG